MAPNALRRRIPTGLAAGVLLLALLFVLFWGLRFTPLPGRRFFGWIEVLVGLALLLLIFPLGIQLIRRYRPWRLRNKLIITYLLMGLAPFVLFLTLVALAAYVTAGQFSILLADSRLHQQLDRVGEENAIRASNLSRILSDRGTSTRSTGQAAGAALGAALPNGPNSRLHPQTTTYIDTAPLSDFLAGLPSAATALASSEFSGPSGVPPWVADLHGNQFRSVVADGQSLFLMAIDQRRIEGTGLLTVVTSVPVDADLIDVIAEGLGRLHLAGIFILKAHTPAEEAVYRAQRNISIYGGQEPRSVNAFDFSMPFFSTMAIREWDTGKSGSTSIVVHSRPSALYRQLFSSSVSALTNSIRFAFIALCILFALIEAAAFWAAVRLSRQITTSVEDLYAATRRVDRGDLTHRIPAHSGREDQLGELSRSFNSMIRSLERLLIEQKEKQRLESELAIAQEVQATLFPRDVRSLPALELHGVCRPARSVSGDYYDFLIFHGPVVDGRTTPETGVGIAVGDISGKGISAALLMATLHSAVRATLLAQNGPTESDGAIFAYPANILALVNQHLYLSTQPSKYATLFLAHYDAASAQLTYSNAGHLPPILLSRDGSVRRLDCGGTVVGLIPNAQYQDGCVQMRPGDILIGYTDGVTEPENDFRDFGEDRLVETVGRYHDQPLQVISDQVMLALDAWIGSAEQPDDITLVLARQA